MVEYFVFNPQNFTTDGIAQMNKEIEDSGRYITTIIDPHIKVSDDYFVYKDGEEMEKNATADGSIANIFVRNSTGDAEYEAICWPGMSVWFDFLNTNAQNYWSSLFSYENFVGSSHIYHVWNDMNEPSVFSDDSKTEGKTLPTDTKHVRANGEVVEHREFHNAYGATQQR